MFQTSANQRFTISIIAVLFVLLVVAALASIYNPYEKAREGRDSNLLSLAKLTSISISKYYELKGVMPWVQYTGAGSSSPGLPWTLIQSQEIGICKDYECTIPGEVEKVVATIEGEIYLKKDDLLYIGKGANQQDPIHICFIPESQNMRRNTGNLHKIDITSRTSAPKQLLSCSDRVTWRNDDVCFRCI